MTDIITLAELKAFKASDTLSTDFDTAGQVAINAAIDLFETEIGRPLFAHDMAEVLSGEGVPLLLPSHWPINSVTLLKVGSDTWTVWDAATLTAPLEANEFQAFIPSHRLWLEAGGGSFIAYSQGYGLTPEIKGAIFPQGVANILVQYNAGYTLGAILSCGVAVGGTGYAVGDTGTISGGGVNATYAVLAVSTGVVTAIQLTSKGSGYLRASGSATTHTTGSGNDDLTVNIYAAEGLAKIKQALIAMAWLFLMDRKLIGMGAKQMGGSMESIQQIKRDFSEYPIIDMVLDHERRRGT